MLWKPHPSVARKRRQKLGLTIEQVCEQTSLSPGTVRRIEQGEATRAETIDALAAALGVSRERLAAVASPTRKKDIEAAEPSPANAPRANAAGEPLVPLRVEAIAPRSRLGALIEREEKVGVDPPLDDAGARIPAITVRAMRSIYTAFGLASGDRYVTRGRLVDQRGLVPAEAAALGTKSGLGARVHVVRQIDDEATFGVTAHVVDPALVRTLLAMHEAEEVRLVVRLVVAPDEKPVFHAFASPAPLPWTFVVERRVGAERSQKRRG